MQVGDLVIWQQTEINDGSVGFASAPAIITGVSRIGRKKLKEADSVTGEIRSSDEDEEIEVYDLTLFLRGRIEFARNVEPYNDILGRAPGAVSFRKAGSEAPKVDLSSKPETRSSQRQREPVSTSPIHHPGTAAPASEPLRRPV